MLRKLRDQALGSPTGVARVRLRLSYLSLYEDAEQLEELEGLLTTYEEKLQEMLDLIAKEPQYADASPEKRREWAEFLVQVLHPDLAPDEPT